MIFEYLPRPDHGELFIILPRFVCSEDGTHWATLFLEHVQRRRIDCATDEYTTRDGRKWIHHWSD